MSLHRQQSGSGRSNRTLCRPLHVALDALNGPGAAQLKRTAFWGLESSRRAPSRAAAHVRYKQTVKGVDTPEGDEAAAAPPVTESVDKS